MFSWLFDLLNSVGGGWQIAIFIISIVIGMLALIKGADWFVSGASDIAKKLRIPSMVIGLTIVSFGTSMPEASVSIASALQGSADLSLGNIVGSNIFNLLIVLGCSAIFAPILVKSNSLKQEFPFMIVVTILLLIFAVFFSISGQTQLLRWEGIIMLIVFGLYMVMNLLNAKKNQGVTEITEIKEVTSIKKPVSMWICLLLLLVGLALIIFGGEVVTYGAKNIALTLGISEALIGLTIVAVGTSLPELVTSIVAARKHENDIALGNVVGSNIFNIVFILGVTSTIQPLAVNQMVIIDIVILLLVTVFAFFLVLRKKKFDKTEGIILITLYIAYLAYIIMRDF